MVNQIICYIPASPKNRLLRSCICCTQKQYGLTASESKLLQSALNLALESNLVECSDHNLESVNQSQSCHQSNLGATCSLDDNFNFLNPVEFSEPPDYLEMRKQPYLKDLGTLPEFDINSFDSNRFEHHEEISFDLKQPSWQSFWNITLKGTGNVIAYVGGTW